MKQLSKILEEMIIKEEIKTDKANKEYKDMGMHTIRTLEQV